MRIDQIPSGVKAVALEDKATSAEIIREMMPMDEIIAYTLSSNTDGLYKFIFESMQTEKSYAVSHGNTWVYVKRLPN